MWQNLTHLDISAVNLISRATIVYLSVLILLRISGKRQIGQMGATEFVAILLISNAVQNAMNGGDNSLSGGLLIAVVIIVLSTTISFLTFKSKFIKAVFEGTPTLLVHKGEVIKKNLAQERLDERELKVLMRKQGVHLLRDVEAAILESNGTLTIFRTNEPPIGGTTLKI